MDPGSGDIVTSMSETSEKIKALRKEKGLTVPEAAEICELSVSVWQKWECGAKEPLPVTLDGVFFRLGKIKAKKK